jgi:pimeloyl-ACP methyl ester carboxylesterase
MARPLRLLRTLFVGTGFLLLIALAAALAALSFVDPGSQAADRPVRVAEAGSRFVTLPFEGTDGLSFHYLEQGAAGPETAFVLLHGFTFNAFTWQAAMPAFAAHGRVVALDQLPYGLSAKPVPGDWTGANPYARESAVDLVLGAMDALDIERAVVVGNSSGGTLALELALAAPERVDGLVLIAPWVYVQRPVIPVALAESWPLERLSLLIARKLGAGGGLLELSYADTARITPERRRLAELHTQTRDWDLAWAALLNRSLSTPIGIGDRLAEIRRPVLVVTGDADRLVAPDDSLRVAEGLPDGEFVSLPGCGHVPHEECPVRFAAAVDAWLARR